MEWIILMLAGVCEVCWAVMMKASRGFTRPMASAGTIVFILLSVVLLTVAMRKLPLGVSYAMWTGIGAAGTALWGMIFLDEPHDLRRIACIALILTGVVGLRFAAVSQ